MKPRDGLCLAIILTVFFFYVSTIRKGQPWPDDFAMYIHEAKNLVEHARLGGTGYIYNQYNPGLGPRLYPPVFPALLIPGYLIGGLNSLRPMQVEVVVFFSGLLVVLWRGLGAALPSPYRAAMLAIVGFSPLLWSYKDLILSDIPFAFFLYLALLEADRLVSDFAAAAKNPWRILGLAGLIYLCYGTRTMGIILVPALLLLSAMYWKRGGQRIAAATILGLLPCLIQWKFFGGEATYTDQLKLSLPKLVEAIFRNVVTYGWSLSTFWENPYTKVLRDVIFVYFAFFAGAAYFRRVRSAPRIYEIFLPFYLSVVLLWPNPAGARYLIPVFPLYVYYCLEGTESVRAWLKVRRVVSVLVPLLVVIFLSYGMEFHHLDFGPFQEGMATAETRGLFSFIKSNTNPKDVFIFRRPRALALFTERSASVYPLSENESNACRYFQTIGVTYFIEAPALDDPSFDEFLAKRFRRNQPVFANSDFRVFRVVPGELQRCAAFAVSARMR